MKRTAKVSFMLPFSSLACPELARSLELNVRLHPQIIRIPKKRFKCDSDTESDSEDGFNIGGSAYCYEAEDDSP